MDYKSEYIKFIKDHTSINTHSTFQCDNSNDEYKKLYYKTKFIYKLGEMSLYNSRKTLKVEPGWYEYNPYFKKKVYNNKVLASIWFPKENTRNQMNMCNLSKHNITIKHKDSWEVGREIFSQLKENIKNNPEDSLQILSGKIDHTYLFMRYLRELNWVF
jgi:hypothetical protein